MNSVVRFFLNTIDMRHCREKQERENGSRLSLLHGVHRSIYMLLIAFELGFEIGLAFPQILEGLFHTIHFVLALNPFAMLASDVTSDGVQNALVAISTTEFALLL